MEKWKETVGHKPLIITGCRQIGKTYSVKEFGHNNYNEIIYINFEESPEQRLIFSDNLDFKTIIDRIETIHKKILKPHQSLVILDEIQSCTNAFSSLKSLSKQNDIDFIALGSFLGLKIDDVPGSISPLGYVDILEMHPMDFEEFMWARGYEKELTQSITASVQSLEAIDPVINKALNEEFRRYIAVGGMPEAVNAYASTGRYMEAYEKLKNIVLILKKDAGRYSSYNDRMKIIRCLESIPNQLAKKNKKFTYADIEKRKGRGDRYYGSALDWLKNAGLIEYCNNVSEPNPPLSEKVISNEFKLYLCDTGLMSVLMENSDIDSLINRDPFSNNGAFMENAVASALIKRGYRLRFYEKKNSTLEIDFILNMQGTVNLLEVKSGRNKKSKSLNTLLSEKDRKRIGYRIADGNILRDEKGAIHLPLYAACFLKEDSIPEISSTDPSSINERFRSLKS